MRSRNEIALLLSKAKSKLASNRKTAHNTVSRKTAEICDAVEPSIVASIATLEAELAQAPEKEITPTSTVWSTSGPIRFKEGPLSQIELEALEIPEFLKREA